MALGAYVVREVPYTIPRTLGKRMALAHAAPGAGSSTPSSAEREADRISGEVRKVLHANFAQARPHPTATLARIGSDGAAAASSQLCS